MTTTDPVLGTCYIEPSDFVARVSLFGADKALTAIGAGNTAAIAAFIASASRAVDTFTSREPDSWAGGTITESHKFDSNTRRVKVNQPPILNLLSYGIRTAPTLLNHFTLTPITTDGANNVSYGSVYYNFQENYLELASWAMAGSITNVLLTIGMYEPVVEIQYTSYASPPQNVVAATGFATAHLMNEYLRNTKIIPGIQSQETVNQSVTANNLYAEYDRFILPPQAARYLYAFTRIAVG